MRAATACLLGLALLATLGARAIAQDEVAAPSAAAMTRMLSPLPGIEGYLLRGIVGHSISVALPVHAGYTWRWQSDDNLALFAPPYRVRFLSSSPGSLAPEVWTFPLVRPGKTVLEFKLYPDCGPLPAKGPERRLVTLMVLTPYEAQQHPPADLNDMVLLK